ncbi:MAG: protein kinase [Propionibacteriaceae bacterium]|jgi:serine/threonine protein kinase|nr:protein kinase [Propionibacteriaceae bacterium]
MATASPPRIPGFTYVADIGHGGFADVYLYTQMTPRRQVAIKVLHSNVASSEAAARLNKEADAMAGLSQHLNIVTVFHSDIAADGRPYLVMEYYPGPALSKGLSRSQKPVDEALSIGIQLAGALESAHRVTVLGAETSSQGILHRDIKPANILVDRSGRPVLGDFGIAMTNAEAERGKAQGLSIPWSPPESFDSNPRPSRQSDIWSLAATIYALLTGRAPFEIPGEGNKQPHALIHRIRNEPYVPLGRVDAPASLDQVLATAMAKSPQSRYPSMKAFGLALREVELELSLRPTQMDIFDDSTSQGLDSDDDDIVGTSLRPISIIDPTASTPSTAPGGWSTTAPQPSVPKPPVEMYSGPPAPIDRTQLRRPGTGPTDAVEETLWRAKGSLEESEGVPTAPPVQSWSTTEPKPKTIPWPIIIGVVVLLVIGGVIAVIAMTGKPRDPVGVAESPTATVANPQDPVGAAIPPTPVDVTGVVDAQRGVAEFTWTNPDPQDGDKYRWVIIGAEDVTPSIASLPQATIKLEEGQTMVCIEVKILRHGNGSPDAQGCAG